MAHIFLSQGPASDPKVSGATVKNLEWLGIEAKASENPRSKDFSGLLALEEELPLKHKLMVCQTKAPRMIRDRIEILSIRDFLETLWNRKWI